MKKMFNAILSIFLFIIINSCTDNGSDPIKNNFRKLKMTIYISDMNDSNKFIKESEYYFDGDVEGLPKRTFAKMFGDANYKSQLSQQRANVPLPYSKFGCQTKDIEYSSDSSIYMITSIEYDNEGFMSKADMQSFSSSNKSLNVIYKRDGDKLIKMSVYEDGVLDKVMEFFYNSKGFCILQIDSSVNSNNNKKAYRRYNEKNQLEYVIWGNDTISGNVTEYFYDDDGNNIKRKSYTKENNDTSNTKISNRVMYKGYLMNPEDIENFEFDADNNIVGYINKAFGNTKFKIEYEFYY
ncbi:MAG: hypothetical protein V1779_04425 [bacterium]